MRELKKVELSQELKSKLKPIPRGVKSIEKFDRCLIVLLDASESMSETLKRKKKIDIAWQVFKEKLQPNLSGWVMGVIVFGPEGTATWYSTPSTSIADLPPPKTNNSTPMLKALKLALDFASKAVVQGRIILITDGLVNDATPEEVLDFVKGCLMPIDTVGIGDKSSPFSYDPQFLKEMSSITGGIFSEAFDIESLASVIEALSPASRPVLGPGKN